MHYDVIDDDCRSTHYAIVHHYFWTGFFDHIDGGVEFGGNRLDELGVDEIIAEPWSYDLYSGKQKTRTLTYSTLEDPTKSRRETQAESYCIKRNTQKNCQGDRPPLAAPKVRLYPGNRHKAVQCRAKADTDEDPFPDTTQNIQQLLFGEFMPITERKRRSAGAFANCGLHRLIRLERKGLQESLGMDKVKKYSARDSDCQSNQYIDNGYLPPHQAQQKQYGHFIYQRRRQ